MIEGEKINGYPKKKLIQKVPQFINNNIIIIMSESLFNEYKKPIFK